MFEKSLFQEYAQKVKHTFCFIGKWSVRDASRQATSNHLVVDRFPTTPLPERCGLGMAFTRSEYLLKVSKGYPDTCWLIFISKLGKIQGFFKTKKKEQTNKL